jgi:coenzyme F420-reducing hydrogenase gamma subunit
MSELIRSLFEISTFDEGSIVLAAGSCARVGAVEGAAENKELRELDGLRKVVSA